MQRVLVVEDEPRLQKLTRTILEGGGYEVVVASDGAAAVSAARASRPEAILMDLSLPGLTGLEATRQIKAELPDVKVIAVTAHSIKGIREASAEAGCDAFLAKPYTAEELLQAVRQFLPEQSARDGSRAAAGEAAVTAARVVLLAASAPEHELLSRLLTEAGFTTLGGEPRSEPLDTVRETLPDALVVGMPPDVSAGLNLLVLKAHDPVIAHIPVVVVMDRDEDLKTRVANLGVLDVLDRPVSATDLRLRVRNAAELRRLRRTAHEASGWVTS